MDDNKSKIILVGNTNDCDYKTIQEALDSIEENSVIKVKPGVYNEHLNFTKKVHLVGCEDSIINKSSNELPVVVLDSSKSCEINVPVEIEGIVFTQKNDLHFDNLSSYIKTSPEFEDKEIDEVVSLFIVNSESNFSNIAILSAEQYGISFRNLKSNLSNSYIHHSWSAAIYVLDDAAPTINNCVISNSNIMGIRLEGSAAPKITSCKIEKTDMIGIHVEDNATPKCISCEILGSKYGVNINAPSSSLFENCIIHDNLYAFQITKSAMPEINKCRIFNNKQMGITTSNDSKPSINDCEVFDNGYGFFIDDDSSPKITKCEIYRNENGGICSLASSKPTVRFCEIYNHAVGISILESSHNSLYERCLIHDCENFGFLLDTNNTVNIKDCGIYKNGSGIHLKNGLLFLEGCDLSKNNNGIEIFSNLIGSYKYCDIHDNKVGILSYVDSKFNFDTCKIYDNAKVNIEFSMTW